MNTVLVSIIIPVYNVDKYISECIESVINQSYENIEIILIDDGSSDLSAKICEEYSQRDKRIVFLTKENGGQSSARNLGLKLAKGKYVLFVDSDDYISDDLVEKCVGLSEKSNSDLIFFNAHSFVDGSNEQIRQNYIRKEDYLPTTGLEVFNQLTESGEYLISPCLIFILKDLLTENDILFYEGIIYEDMIFTYQVFCKSHKASQLNETLYERRYRQNSTVTSKKTQFSLNSSIKVFDNVLDFAERECLLNEKAHQAYLSRCAFAVFNQYRQVKSDQKNRRFIRDFKNKLKKYDYFFNPALKSMCYGYLVWATYKLFSKIKNRLSGR